MPMSKLITFEGIDGCGKSSVIEGVKQKLEAKGHNVLVLREPGTTAIGESIRELIKSETPRHPSTDLYLFLASRNDMVKQVLVPASGIYDYILIDRYTDSTVAYQGYGIGYDISTINILQRAITKDVRIDRTIYLDVSLEEAEKRRQLRGDAVDKYEDAEFLKRVKEGYEIIIKNEPDRFVVLKNEDLNKTIDTAVRTIIHQTKTDVTRTTLKQHAGKELTLRAVVARPGRDKDELPTLMLKHVKKKHGQKIMADHIWVPYTRDIVLAGSLIPGDIIEFTATATPYVKRHRGQDVDEYGISDVKDVKLVKAAQFPKDIEEDWTRNDLSYIHSVTQPELYNELLSRYVRFVSAMIYKYYNGDV